MLYKSNSYRCLLTEMIAEVKKAMETMSSCAPLLPDTYNEQL